MISSTKALSLINTYYHSRYYCEDDLFTNLSDLLRPFLDEGMSEEDIDDAINQCYVQINSANRITRMMSTNTVN